MATGLQSPVMELTGEPQKIYKDGDSRWQSAGHSGEVFAARFDPTGQHIASGSMDRDICRLVQPTLLRQLWL